jgi:hypothetical protein
VEGVAVKARVTRDDVLNALRTTDELPTIRRRSVGKSKWTGRMRYIEDPSHRTIYEAGKGVLLRPSGQFFIDYATYPGGTSDEIPRSIIDELEREGKIRRAFPDKPKINAWVLA